MPVGIRNTQTTTVTSSSQKFTNPMNPGQQYVFSANVDCWVKVTTSGGSAAADTADNIMYVAGQQLPLKSPDDAGATTNSYVHVIRDSTDGSATLGIIEGR